MYFYFNYFDGKNPYKTNNTDQLFRVIIFNDKRVFTMNFDLGHLNILRPIKDDALSISEFVLMM